MRASQYRPSYHHAIAHLVTFGGYRGNRAYGRKLIALALRGLRADHGRERAQLERRHMLFITGQFPAKGTA